MVKESREAGAGRRDGGGPDYRGEEGRAFLKGRNGTLL